MSLQVFENVDSKLTHMMQHNVFVHDFVKLLIVLTFPRAAEAYPDRGLVSLKNPKAGEAEPSKDFFFDAVFGPVVEQKHIYDICASGVVESVLNGYNGTIFAYGQVMGQLLYSP